MRPPSSVADPGFPRDGGGGVTLKLKPMSMVTSSNSFLYENADCVKYRSVRKCSVEFFHNSHLIRRIKQEKNTKQFRYFFVKRLLFYYIENLCETRMHSSRMHTARSSSHPPEPNTPLRPDPSPRPGTPQPGNPLRPDPPTRHPPGPDTPPDQTPPKTRHTPCGKTRTCKHITLPQTSFADGN